MVMAERKPQELTSRRCRKRGSMSQRTLNWMGAALLASVFSILCPLIAQSQTTPHVPDGWSRPVANLPKKPGPPPVHDISGTWEPANSPSDGIQGTGSKSMPADGKHEPPYTPLGLELLNRTKPGNGNREVLPADIGDPVFFCNPQGMPREDLYELRETQILQMPQKIVVLYEFNKIWRVIWTDGRDFPKDPEPRWFGYSIGRWVDDTTLVVQTIGTDERTWVDKAGRPHSGDLRVEERFHRVDHDHLELTVTIDDAKMYTKPWVAMDKFPFHLLPDDFDVREMICSPAETAEYNKVVGSQTK
jgi:hypothetical protein